MYGVVTVQRAKAKSAGGFEILPFETSLKLINGKATIESAETDGTGPFYDSVYLFRVQNGYCGRRYGFMAALPDGTTPITTGELPMVDPITGEGIYMDAQEWNELYGDLPNRVDGLEVRVDSLEAVAGLSPESPIDGQTANLIQQPDTLTNAALTTAIGEAITLPSSTKVPGDNASTYPPGVSVTTGRVADGWPQVRGSHTLFTRITTEKPRSLESAIQYATAYLTVNSGSYTSNDIMYRVSDSYGDWGSWQTVQSATSVNNSIQQELKIALTSTVNTDELQHSILLDSFNGVSKTLSNGIATFFHVPFKLRVTSLNLVFDTWSVSPDAVNYTTFTLRKYDPTVPAGASIAAKHTSTEGITPRKPWLFDAVSWSASMSVLERGQTLSIGWANQGTAKVDMPMLVTIGYEPL